MTDGLLQPTPRQREAIEAPIGPVLVVAGPGAGKTFCLIERIRWLITEQQVRPERILAVTFTNKAADEIANRLKDLPGVGDVNRGTLHALCARILREHGSALGIPRGFGIADEKYQRLVLQRLGAWRKRVTDLLTLFSRKKLEGRQLVTRDQRLFAEYEQHLKARQLLDFDDLIAETARLLREHPGERAAVAGQWDHILVDEFQDLSPAQYAVLATLAAEHRSIFGVGDDEQSIFSWTGADPTILRRFAENFGIEHPIVLDVNRRCATQIFDTARRLLAVNPSLFAKDLVANHQSPHGVVVKAFPDDDAEADWLVFDLVADRLEHALPWGEYAILYRKHEVGAALESRLLNSNIPCRLARGRALKDDAIIGYVVAALKLMRASDDPVLVEAFAEAVLPEQLVDRIRRHMRDRGSELLAAVRDLARRGERNDPDTKRCWRFIYHVENLAAMPRMHGDLGALVDDLLAQPVGAYRNVLEERHDELSDPADDPEIVELAERFHAALDGRRVVWVGGFAPTRIPVRGLLLGAGVSVARYLGAGSDVKKEDVVVEADPLSVFKALQFMHAGRAVDELSDYVAFDLETTDLDVDACEVVELGAVRVRGGVAVDRFHSLVRPARAISPQAAEQHGYDTAAVAEAPAFGEIWPAFRSFVGSDLLVGHNARNFDLPVLTRMASGMPGADNLVVFDSLVPARALYPNGAGLEALAERFGLDGGRAHHALDDSETLVKVLAELTRRRAQRARKSSLTHLLDYLGLGLALSKEGEGAEVAMLRQLTRTFALGPWSECLEFYETERARLDDASLPSLGEVIERLGGKRLMERLRADRKPEDRYPDACRRLRGLIGAAGTGPLDEQLDRFLELVALSISDGAEVDRQAVNLLTLHATKGLEFSRVYVVGVEDYQLPGYWPTVDNRTHEIEEARRLLYVGMTRARDRLVLTRADRRLGKDAGGSRFLTEMDLTA